MIRGNAAILKCTIPSFVAEFVSVDSWVGSDGSTFKPTNDYGTTVSVLCLSSTLLPPPPRQARRSKSSKWHVVTIRFRSTPVWRRSNGGGNANHPRVNEPSHLARLGINTPFPRKYTRLPTVRTRNNSVSSYPTPSPSLEGIERVFSRLCFSVQSSRSRISRKFSPST